MRWTVEHGFYGCESGCCGYRLSNDSDNRERFEFEHPDATTDEALIVYARQTWPDLVRNDDEVVIGEWRSCM